MRITRFTASAVVLLLVGFAAGMFFSHADAPVIGADDPAGKKKKNEELSDFMRQKLDSSAFVLEGLLTENFDLLTKGAKRMSEMSRAEKWRVSNDVMYRHHSEDFQARVEKLLKTAKDENSDAAALAYFDMTMSCVECHKWVRRVLVADAKPMKVDGVAATRLKE